MISNELRETIDTQFRIKNLLWIGLTVGLILYFFAVYFITTSKEPNPNISQMTQYVFAGFGFLLIIIAIAIRKFSFSEDRLKSVCLSAQINSDDWTEKITKYLSRQQVFYIISLAINDSIGILGIAIGFISRDINKALPYILVAILLNIWVYPKKERFLANLQKTGQ